MKKKIITATLICSMLISITACGGSANNSDTKSEPTTPEATADPTSAEKSEAEQSDQDSEGATSDLDALGDVEVEKELFDVTLTIPVEYVGEASQEDLNAQASEIGYKVVLNDDGSATYTMTKSQHKEMLSAFQEEINSALAEMVGSEDYPNITEVTANDDFTSFTVTTTSTELGMNESFSVMAFYMYGGMYGIFSGENVDNVHVDFVNAESGEIISSSDSKDAGNSQ